MYRTSRAPDNEQWAMSTIHQYWWGSMTVMTIINILRMKFEWISSLCSFKWTRVLPFGRFLFQFYYFHYLVCIGTGICISKIKLHSCHRKWESFCILYSVQARQRNHDVFKLIGLKNSRSFEYVTMERHSFISILPIRFHCEFANWNDKCLISLPWLDTF